jgi:hypothetical protein
VAVHTKRIFEIKQLRVERNLKRDIVACFCQTCAWARNPKCAHRKIGVWTIALHEYLAFSGAFLLFLIIVESLKYAVTRLSQSDDPLGLKY